MSGHNTWIFSKNFSFCLECGEELMDNEKIVLVREDSIGRKRKKVFIEKECITCQLIYRRRTKGYYPWLKFNVYDDDLDYS